MNDGGVAELAEKFRGRGYTFRCFPGVRCECLTFQAGRIETTRVVVPARLTCARVDVEVRGECFHLLAYGSTADALAEKLAQLPPPPQCAWQELIG